MEMRDFAGYLSKESISGRGNSRSKFMRWGCVYLRRETAGRPCSQQQEVWQEMWLGIGHRLPGRGALEAPGEPPEDGEKRNDTA